MNNFLILYSTRLLYKMMHITIISHRKAMIFGRHVPGK